MPSQCSLAEHNAPECLPYDRSSGFDLDGLLNLFPLRLACFVCFSVFILKHPPNHRLAFFVPDLGGSDLLQSRLFEPWHEEFKVFGGLSQVKLHITLVWEGFDREVDQCGLCLVHRLSSFSVLALEEFADLNQL